MTKSQRSTTGCVACKSRRKKCDETKPRCLRCLSAGRPCSYDYVEYSHSEKHRVKRTKPAAQNSYNSDIVTAETIPIGSSLPDPGPSAILSYAANSNYSVSHDMRGNDTSINLNQALARDPTRSLPYDISFDTQPIPIGRGLHSSNNPLGVVRVPTDAPQVYGTIPVTSGPSMHIVAELELEPEDDEDEEGTGDLEGVHAILCRPLTMDKNVKDNTLSFVLQCYSEWAIASVFEPRKMAYIMREQIIEQFAFENSRVRTILLANIMSMYAKNLTMGRSGATMLRRLALTAQMDASRFIESPPSPVPELDQQNAIRVLDNVLEILSLHTHTLSTSECFQLVCNTAAVFRRACPEPEGQPVNLANIMLSPNLNLRHFGYLEILSNVATGRPLYFQFEVPFSLELCDQMYRMQDSCGLQWLYGVPDQFIMLFAWIYSLSQRPDSDNLELVAWIETNLPQIKLAIDHFGDPLLRIRRMAVLECWRFVVLIYLYMFLCKSNASDPRVVHTHTGFMRLIRGLKPGRHPDCLIAPIIIAGVATIEEQDRDTIRQRILNVQQWATRGTAANDHMRVLEDIWARTRAERRPAVWSDLREAYYRVSGQ
ncbi:Fungal specific transcription factor domain [Rhizoctonia solani]|uniref:Fungal specific transcription factor domain n=1 Tax=Rhizoctonia solani TaxID=456999 RepID=A0A8H8NSD6_9AGAM|nr:Fungal specific transcription factor domain [Rhizoctonia solani]QRW18640.1 Fungal specific transcription factor domain [Rhizoctonia solani]